MKTWFNEGQSSAAKELKEKYGEYPGLWKEVLNWRGWKEARKEYLKHQQQSEGSEVPRKRKSRWGAANNGNDDDPSKRRSRWGDNGGTSLPPPPPPVAPIVPQLVLPGVNMPLNLPPEKQEQMRHLQAQLRDINDKLESLEREAARVDALPRGHRERSPSPPPSKYLNGKCSLFVEEMNNCLNAFFLFFLTTVYGPDGMRKNTRAVRWRERYSAERQDILERIMNLNPNVHARKTMSHLLVRKRVNKVPIPIEKHPNYNFIGLIIGPRGKTQKELEAKTGCKIAIRGKGSVKEGARGRRDGKVMEGDHEPLHVVITGDDQRAVDAATDMIEQMLVVIDDEKNVHKQQQLRELALLNGTLKEDEFCDICGEKGHRSFECPKRFAMNNNRPLVKCAICGDTSHPTRDCTRKPSIVDSSNPQEQQQIDSEYLSFMAELDGKKADEPAAQPPSGLPHPTTNPVTAGGNMAVSLPPPPMAPAGHLPLPPQQVALPPPPAPTVNQNYYGAQPAVQPPFGGVQAPYQNGHQQQAQQVRPGEETSSWDPSAYYGSGGQGQASSGFNWWEK
jgi:splicing factor 1